MTCTALIPVIELRRIPDHQANDADNKHGQSDPGAQRRLLARHLVRAAALSSNPVNPNIRLLF